MGPSSQSERLLQPLHEVVCGLVGPKSALVEIDEALFHLCCEGCLVS